MCFRRENDKCKCDFYDSNKNLHPTNARQHSGGSRNHDYHHQPVEGTAYDSRQHSFNEDNYRSGNTYPNTHSNGQYSPSNVRYDRYGNSNDNDQRQSDGLGQKSYNDQQRHYNFEL